MGEAKKLGGDLKGRRQRGREDKSCKSVKRQSQKTQGRTQTWHEERNSKIRMKIKYNRKIKWGQIKCILAFSVVF